MLLLGDAVLREIRPRPWLPLVLENARYTLPHSTWTVHFVHGPNNTQPVLEHAALARAINRGALRLRRYDDRAKFPGLQVPRLDAYEDMIYEHLRAQSCSR